MGREENIRKERDKRFLKGIEKSAIEGAAAETVQRFGSAAKQHYVAYSGVDNEIGKQLSKGLKSIAGYKVNPEYAEQNIKQQAGFSAEVKAVARRNAQKIINRENTRTVRTDDLGSVNDQFYDLYDIDVNGRRIAGTGSQLKFVGGTPDDLLTKLNSKKFQKYIDADTWLDIANDDYDAIMGAGGNPGLIDGRINALEKQAVAAEKNGKSDVAISKRAQIEKYKKIKKNLRKAGLTRKEAIEAKLYAGFSTAKDIVRISHEAGKAQLKHGAAIAGATSFVRNIVACTKGEKTTVEAAQSVALDTGKGAVTSYATAFAGTTIKGAMQNSTSTYVKALAKTNLAAGLVTTTMNVGKTMHQYFSGAIDGEQCIEQLGENGVGEIGSAMFAAVGVAATSGAPALVSVIGGIAGATFGYAAAVAVYQELATALREAKIAHEERIQIERECAEAVQMIRQYREEMEAMVSQYLLTNISVFNAGFNAMDSAILKNDINGFIKGNVEIQKVLGRKVQFSSLGEFDTLMDSDVPLKL